VLLPSERWQVDKTTKFCKPIDVADDQPESAPDRRVPGLGGQMVTWVCEKPGCEQQIEAAEKPDHCPLHRHWGMKEA
jgi:hypothetical protein